MSFLEIEAELETLTPAELRQLAVKSRDAYVAKENGSVHDCSEEDPKLLAALDKAIAQVDAFPAQGYSGDEVRARLNKWTSR